MLFLTIIAIIAVPRLNMCMYCTYDIALYIQSPSINVGDLDAGALEWSMANVFLQGQGFHAMLCRLKCSA